MGISYRPLPTKCIMAFLTKHGFYHDRTKGSHDIWKKKGNQRSVPIRERDKEVPALHIKTCCKVIGCTMEDVYAWAEENC